MKHLVPVLGLLASFGIAGCAVPPATTAPVISGPDTGAEDTFSANRPQARPAGLKTTSLISAPPPPPAAKTVEDFDTTSKSERAAAAAAPSPATERALGSTVASLGDVTQPGFWLKTPLVDAQTAGRVLYPATGKSAQVELLPLDGPKTAGSRISLPAMRLLDAPLTELPVLQVFAGG